MDTLRVALVQSELVWEDAQANTELFDRLLAPLTDVDLIVLPEMFNSGFSMTPQRFAESMDGQSIAWMRQTATRLGSAVCGSLAVREGEHFANRFVFAHPDGALDCYDKRHCFRMSGEHEIYRAGEQRVLIEYRGWKILPQVCYDLRFPVFSRNSDDYDLAIYVANWPQVRSHPWRTLLQARAIENLAYCVGVNRIGSDGNGLVYSGDSLVADFKGELLHDARDRAQVARLELDRVSLAQFRAKFPAHLDADSFALGE